ncbi:XP_036355917.1homeobox protein Hox-D11-like [Octopus vulgaris]|uniref:XP_036355917.1homeobox protein Hox-D11-like n=1 Tax=Octopus vulgaris TaxID=6645 RepID=A0AA36BVI7_OCTVU|nr:XP_036355917.1homeobox protein Hox-D11-like [Octopus vulgaris]
MFTRSQPFPRELQYDSTRPSDDKQKEDKATFSRVTSNVSPELRLQPATTKEPRNYEEIFRRSNCYRTAMINSTASTIPSNFQRNIFDCYSNGKTLSDAVFSGNTTCEDFEPNFCTASFDSEKNLPGHETSVMDYSNENEKVYSFPRFLKTHRNTNPTRDCQSKFLNFDTQTQSCKSGHYLNNSNLSLPDCSRFMQMENEPNVTVFRNISQRPFNSHMPISIRSGPPDCTRTRQPIIRMEPEYSINADEEYEIDGRTCVNVNIDKLHTGGLDKTTPLCSNPVHPSNTPPSLSSTAAAGTTPSPPLTTASASSSDSKEIPQRDQAKPFRQPYLPFQLELLEASYNRERFCSGETRKKLVKRTGLSDKQIRICNKYPSLSGVTRSSRSYLLDQ